MKRHIVTAICCIALYLLAVEFMRWTHFAP